jgi:hypothetical protein
LRALLYILLFLSAQVASSQNNQLELKISNDKFIFQDRYYTAGFHATYRKSIKSLPLLKTQPEEKLQLNVALGSEIYTPTNLISTDVNNFDRPYAGWLFVAIEIAKIKQKSALFLALETGVTGTPSLAGNLQIGFHDFFNIESDPPWTDEIAFSWLVNLKALKVYEVTSTAKTSFQNHSSVSLGSKDTYVANEFQFFFGKFLDLQNSYRLNALSGKTRKEVFGFVTAGYRYVLLNALIEGNPFNNNDPFTTAIERQILTLKAGGVWRTEHYIYKLEYNFNTKETPTAVAHAFGAFTFGFNF